MRRPWVVLLPLFPLLPLVAACRADAPVEPPREFTRQVIVVNSLLAPVMLQIDGIPVVSLGGGRTSGIAVSSDNTWISWTSAKPTDSNGRPMPDHIGEVRLRVTGVGDRLVINNVIEGQTYFTARILNTSGAPATIGVLENGVVECVGTVNAAPPGGTGVLQIGYYRLRPGTAVRAYRDPERCEGVYSVWPTAGLSGYEQGSGFISLLMDTPP